MADDILDEVELSDSKKHHKGMKTLSVESKLREHMEDIAVLIEMVDRIGITKLKKLIHVVEELEDDKKIEDTKNIDIDKQHKASGCFSCFRRRD